jgi:hypothetical protein
LEQAVLRMDKTEKPHCAGIVRCSEVRNAVCIAIDPAAGFD